MERHMSTKMKKSEFVLRLWEAAMAAAENPSQSIRWAIKRANVPCPRNVLDAEEDVGHPVMCAVLVGSGREELPHQLGLLFNVERAWEWYADSNEV